MEGQLLIRPHPLSTRDEISAQFPPGTTLQMIADSAWPRDIQSQAVLSINGDIIPRHMWARVRPNVNAIVRGTLVLQGGGGSKNIFAIIATIAVAFFAPYAAGAMGFAQGSLAFNAAVVGITIVGNMAVSAMFKPPAMDVGNSGADARSSPVYSISGQSNQATPYNPIPRVYGTNKFFPRLAATPFIENVADKQYLYMLLDFGYGPLTVDALRIGDTFLNSYKGVDYRLWPEFVAGHALHLYTNDTHAESVAVDLLQNVEHVRTSAIDSVRLVVDLLFPRGLVRFNATGDRQTETAQVRIRLRKVGTPDWIGFNYYPGSLSNSAAQTQYRTTAAGTGTVTVEARDLIMEGRDRFYGFRAGKTTFNIVGGDVPPVGSLLNMKDGSTYTVITVFGSVMTINAPLTRNMQYSANDNANARLPFRPGTVTESTGILFASAASGDPFTVGVSIDVPIGQYDVEVMRQNPVYPPQDNRFNDVSWVNLRSAAPRPPIAPKAKHTILELKIEASDQLSGVIQNINAIVSARVDTWDGAQLVPVYTRNPAWAFLDVLIGPANPRPVPLNRIDLDGIRAWANFCDQKVAGADGEMEFRYQFDHIVDYSTTIYQLLDAIASAGRATVSWRDNKVGVIIDQEQTVPVQLFTPRNSWDFNSTRVYLETPHALRCKFIDPAINWQEGTRVVYYDGYDANTATKFEDVQLFGITRSSQAWRDGRYIMAQGVLRRENFTIETDVESLVCLRGDLVAVQHDVLKVGGESSRVVTVENNSLVYQYDPLPSLPAGSYGLRIRTQSGTILGPLAAQPVPPSAWQLSAPVAGISEGDLLVWGVLGIETGEYLVKNISPGPDLTASLDLVEIARAIYTADTGDLPPYVPPANGRPGETKPQPVQMLRITQVNKTVGRRPAADLYIEWNEPNTGNYPKVSLFEVVDRTDFLSIGEAIQTSRFQFAHDLDLISSRYLTDTVQFAAQAVDSIGARSDFAFVAEDVKNPLWVPDAVPFFSSNVQGEKTTLTWRDPVNFNLPGNAQIGFFDIRWSPDTSGAASFDKASRVSEVITWGSYTTTVPTRNGIYFIKPLTTSGVYSVDAAHTVTITEDLNRKDYFANLRFEPDWDGQFINCEKVGDSLRLLHDPETGDYFTRGYWIRRLSFAFEQTLQCRVGSTMNVYGIRDAELLSSPHFTPLANAVPIGTAGQDQYDAKVWVAGSDRLSTTIEEWLPIESADPLAGTSIDLSTDAWPIISGELLVKQLFFIVELRSFSDGVTPVVTMAGVDIDFPERLEAHGDIVVPATGYRLVFDYPFVYPPVTSMTLQSAQPGDYIERGTADQYGVNMFVRNSAGVAKLGLVDVQLWGVGRLQSA